MGSDECFLRRVGLRISVGLHSPVTTIHVEVLQVLTFHYRMNCSCLGQVGTFQNLMVAKSKILGSSKMEPIPWAPDHPQANAVSNPHRGEPHWPIIQFLVISGLR